MGMPSCNVKVTCWGLWKFLGKLEEDWTFGMRRQVFGLARFWRRAASFSLDGGVQPVVGSHAGANEER